MEIHDLLQTRFRPQSGNKQTAQTGEQVKPRNRWFGCPKNTLATAP